MGLDISYCLIEEVKPFATAEEREELWDDGWTVPYTAGSFVYQLGSMSQQCAYYGECLGSFRAGSYRGLS